MERNGLIFKAMTTLSNGVGDFDPVTLGEQLKLDGCLQKVGGLEYLSELMDNVGTSANVHHYAQIILARSVQRKLIETARQIEETNYMPVDDISANVASAVDSFLKISTRDSNRGPVKISGPLDNVIKHIEDLAAGRVTPGLSTGLADLDRMIGGYTACNLHIIAGRPSMGKTVLGVQGAIACGEPALVFSLEMSKEQLAMRILSMKSKVNLYCLRTGRNLYQDDWTRIHGCYGNIAGLPLWIDDTPALTIPDIKARAMNLDRQLAISGQRLSLIVVDYLQYVRAVGYKSREQEVASISRDLKALAKEMHLPVVLLAQLNRGVELRADPRPMLADLRESGAIEQDADVVMMLYREEKYKPCPENVGKAEVIVRKQRNGPCGSVDCMFIEEYPMFVDVYREG